MNKLLLPIVAILIGLVAAGCSTTDPDVTSQLEAQSDRLSHLEEQIDEFSAILDEMTMEDMDGEHAAMEGIAFEISVAQFVMDTAGFHAIDDALTETSEIDPAYASTVARVARIVASITWPDDLAEDADHLLEVLAEFQSTLSEDDIEAALPLAGMAHDHQHDLSAAIAAWLSGEMSTEGEHEHEEAEGSD